MKIWKLSINEPNDKIWEGRRLWGPFLVRAQNENQARTLVMDAGVYNGCKSGENGAIQVSKYDPWGSQDYTICTEMHDGKYPTDGEARVLVSK